jgi:hypothetical protein
MTTTDAGTENQVSETETNGVSVAAAASLEPETFVAGQNEIERIMKEIEDLQIQMTQMAIHEPPRPSIISNRIQANLARAEGAPVTTDSSVPEAETHELFKEIEGGEDSLVAETLAGLPSPGQPETVTPTRLQAVPSHSTAEPRRSPGNPGRQPLAGENALSMTVTGQMSLKLDFQCEGQEVFVHFNSESIRVEFSDGTEFKIPVKRDRSLKKIG